MLHSSCEQVIRCRSAIGLNLIRSPKSFSGALDPLLLTTIYPPNLDIGVQEEGQGRLPMADRANSYTTPPTSPRQHVASPRTSTASSPRLPHAYPLPPPPIPPVGAHPRKQTRREAADVIEFPLAPATLDLGHALSKETGDKVLLELADGSSFTGFSFGAVKSVSGELVFQTGACLLF